MLLERREPFWGTPTDISSRSQATIRQTIAEARMEITKSRLLCYLAAVQADDHGFKAARAFVAMTKAGIVAQVGDFLNWVLSK